jgi:FlaA1/EpsC-like NDP-sugar epimerase
MLAVAISALTFKNSIFELDFPRAMILYAWLLGIIMVAMGREVHRRIWHRLRMRGVGRDRVLVVGAGEAAQAIVQKIQWSPYLGYELIGVVSSISPNGQTPPNGGATNGDKEKEQALEVVGASILGRLDDLPQVIETATSMK